MWRDLGLWYYTRAARIRPTCCTSQRVPEKNRWAREWCQIPARPAPVNIPRHVRHQHTVVRALHPRRRGLQERARSTGVHRPPPPGPDAGVIPRARPSALRAPAPGPGVKAYRHDQDLAVTVRVRLHRHVADNHSTPSFGSWPPRRTRSGRTAVRVARNPRPAPHLRRPRPTRRTFPDPGEKGLVTVDAGDGRAE